AVLRLIRRLLLSTPIPYTTLFRSVMTSSRQPRPIQPVPVVLDTCVLLSRPVSSLLLGLAQAQYVQPYWSHLIKEEWWRHAGRLRSEEHTSELQSRFDLVCRLLLEK